MFIYKLQTLQKSVREFINNRKWTNEVFNEDGTTKIYRIKRGIRVKALEYLTDEFDDEIMEEQDKYHD